VKRLRRWLFNIAGALSCALCVGLCILWLLTCCWGWLSLTLVRQNATGRDCSWSLGTGGGWLSFQFNHLIYPANVHVKFGKQLVWMPNPRLRRGTGIQWFAWLFDVRAPSHAWIPAPSQQWIDWRPLYISLDRRTYTSQIDIWDIFDFQFWFLIVLSGTLSVVWLRRRPVKRKGYCEICGYDLRATPDRCPECGKITEKAI